MRGFVNVQVGRILNSHLQSMYDHLMKLSAGGTTIKGDIIDCYVSRRRVSGDGVGEVMKKEGKVESCKTWFEDAPKICIA